MMCRVNIDVVIGEIIIGKPSLPNIVVLL